MRLKQKQSGYLLLLLMLSIAGIAAYLVYQLSLNTVKTRSWQVQKTATEVSYWMDIEANYVMDNGLVVGNPNYNGATVNAIQLLDLIKNDHYFPYGLSRPVTFPSSTIQQVSEFLCSSLPGINHADGTLTATPNAMCPIPTDATVKQHCALDQPAWYSCANNQTTSTAQYYTNANFISMGNVSGISAGVGLIVRTPGLSNPYIVLGGPGGSTATLPNNSAAQSLISILPAASFNLYDTTNPNVNGIGLASYIFTNISISGIANTKYSKIVDMGLVQAVNLDYEGIQCLGWDDNGQKTGLNYSYNPENPGTGWDLDAKNTFPPSCIRIDTKLYGPSGTVERCDQVDVLYTLYRNYFESSDSQFRRFASFTDSKVINAGSGVFNVFLSQKLLNNSASEVYSANDSTSHASDQKYTWLAYVVRCTRKGT